MISKSFLSTAAAVLATSTTLPLVSAQTSPPTTAEPTSTPTSSPTTSPTSSPTSSPTISPTVLIGCPPLWETGPSTSYAPGALVSHPESSSGDAIRAVYECKEEPYNLYCPQSGYEPGTLYGPNAWTRLGSCNSLVAFVEPTSSPTGAPTSSPTFSEWEKVGCPDEFDATLATAYVTGEVVEVEGVVYECISTFQGRCHQAGWEPGTGSEWEEAWVILGSCTGTITPTTSPSGEAWEKSGCPESYASGSTYEIGETVESIGSVFECRPYPYSQLCGVAGYEPGTGQYWDAAWIRLGTCSGTIAPTDVPTKSPSSAPTTSPTFSLWELEGCPPAFDEAVTYEGGDTVERNGLVFECTNGDSAPHCGQSGYEPGTGVEWERAWTILGSCTGTIAPTAATTIEQWERVGCPEEYAAPPATYEEDSIVSLNGVVYQCKGHPDTGFCNIHSPDSDYGYLGWDTLGSCSGTLTPTTSPTSNPTSAPTTSPTHPEWEKGGCPEAFDTSLATMYMMGDIVEYEGVVYECISTFTGRCNQAGWEPGMGQSWEEAWSVLGSCTGTITPTTSPTMEILPTWEKTGCPAEYDAANANDYVEGDYVSAYGSRVYQCKPWPDAGFCKMFSPEDETNGSLGWTTIGGCTGTLAPTNAPTAPDFSDCAFPEYDVTATYEAGDQVHAGGDVYECKPLPFALWCSNPGYIPGTTTGSMAWDNTNLSC